MLNRLTPEKAIQKARHFCAYQERSHAEVKEKLYSFGLRKTEVETLLSSLIEDDYLNEARFAAMFAGGKFRMKQWGRVKIRYELRQRQVSDYNINKAMKEIEDAAYEETFNKVFNKKAASVKGEKNPLVKKKKIMDYLLQKGYEREMIISRLNDTI